MIAITGLVALGITVWFKFLEPTGNLVAEVRYGAFEVPPGLAEDLRGLVDAAKVKEETSDLRYLRYRQSKHDRALAPQIAEETVNAITQFQDRHLSYILREYELLDGYWSVAVTNVGSREVRSVKLVIPHVVEAQVEREGRSAFAEDSNGVFDLGALQPDDSVSVFAWTSNQPRFFVPWDHDIRLTHAEGRGQVSVQHPVGPFWSAVAEFAPYIFFALLTWAALLLLVRLLTAIFTSRSRVATLTHDPPKEDDQG